MKENIRQHGSSASYRGKADDRAEAPSGGLWRNPALPALPGCTGCLAALADCTEFLLIITHATEFLLIITHGEYSDSMHQIQH